MRGLYTLAAGLVAFVASCMPYKQVSAGGIAPISGESMPDPAALVSAEFGAGMYGGRMQYFKSTHSDQGATIDSDTLILEAAMRKYFGMKEGEGPFVSASGGILTDLNPTAHLPSGTDVPLEGKTKGIIAVGGGVAKGNFVAEGDIAAIFGDNANTVAGRLLVGGRF